MIPSKKIVEIKCPCDATIALKTFHDIMSGLGLREIEIDRMDIVVSELAANLVKHAEYGTLAFSLIERDGMRGIQIESIDNGPGIDNVNIAFSDGYTTAGSLGCGLGAINRFSDEMEIHTRTSGNTGTRILCKKWIHNVLNAKAENNLDIGVATLPHPGMKQNGDSFFIKNWGNNVLLGVIDGLGHGLPAYKAAMAARQYIESHFHMPLEHIFAGTERACKGTRGVVMALALFDIDSSDFSYMGLGNIEARLIEPENTKRLVSKRGIVGMNNGRPICFRHEWKNSSILVLHTDGIKSHWKTKDCFPMACTNSESIARNLLSRERSLNDDATVMVVKAKQKEVP